MIGKCFIEIKDKKIGVLFGVRLFQIIDVYGLKMTEDESDHMNSVNLVWAGIKNNCDLSNEECNITRAW